MIYHNDSSEKTEIAFLQAFKSLKSAELLRTSGIRKAQGISVQQVLNYCYSLFFKGKTYIDS